MEAGNLRDFGQVLFSCRKNYHSLPLTKKHRIDSRRTTPYPRLEKAGVLDLRSHRLFGALSEAAFGKSDGEAAFTNIMRGMNEALIRKLHKSANQRCLFLQIAGRRSSQNLSRFFMEIFTPA